jgi:uncharacterized membrane protein YtjA (UPF0391 family)
MFDSQGTAAAWHAPRNLRGTTGKEIVMLYWAFMFLVLAVIAGALGVSGVAGAAVDIAWILFVVGLIAAVIFGLLGRRAVP